MNDLAKSMDEKLHSLKSEKDAKEANAAPAEKVLATENEEVQEGCFGMDTMTVFYGNEYMVIRKMMPVSSCCILKSLSLKERIL